jgi:hypothetical protein
LAQALANLSWYALVAGEFARALQAASEAVEIAGSDLGIEIKRGHALLATGSRREAIEQYKRIVHGQARNGKKWSDEIVRDLELLISSGVAIETLSEEERAEIAEAELVASRGP